MKFDFYEQYKSYSTIDLLKIVKNPADYQAAAIEAAQKILNDREISSQETQHVEDHFQQLADKAQAKADQINAYKEKAADFFQPVINPGTEVHPRKWLNILLLVIAIEYLFIFYSSSKYFIYFLKCEGCKFDTLELLSILPVVYIPFLFYLLYKKKRWGWILLFSDKLFSLIAKLTQVYIFFKYQEVHEGSSSTFLFSIFVQAAFVFFLWRKSISDLFGVSMNTKKDTMVIVTVISILFCGLLQFAFA